jgi:poly-beta-1,6-N-acetyl-D-glucosamine N-deacetylase
MKSLIKRALFLLLRWCGLPRFWRFWLQRGKVTILCYHDPAPDVLAAHVAQLRNDYSIMSLRDFVAWHRSGGRETLPRNPLVITLDDGHAGNARLLDLVMRDTLPITILLCSGIVGTQRHFWWKEVGTVADRTRLKNLPDEERLRELERWGYQETASYPDRQALSREEIRTMAPYIDFQAHTRLHPLLPKCTANRAMEEILGCKDDLVRDFGLDIYAFAYPNGDNSDRDVDLVRQAGYTCALTTEEGGNDDSTDVYRLKRIIISDNAGVDELVVKASGFWAALNRLRG